MNLGGGPAFGMNSPLGQIVSGSGGSGLGPQPSSPSRMFGGSGLPSSSMDSGGTSSPFNQVLSAPSPSTVPQGSSTTSMAHIEQIRQVGVNFFSSFNPFLKHFNFIIMM
jgi:hypothetical protein